LTHGAPAQRKGRKGGRDAARASSSALYTLTLYSPTGGREKGKKKGEREESYIRYITSDSFEASPHRFLPPLNCSVMAFAQRKRKKGGGKRKVTRLTGMGLPYLYQSARLAL